MRIAIAILVPLLASAPAAAGQHTATFLVRDMTCLLCPVTVTTAIKRQPRRHRLGFNRCQYQDCDGCL